MQKIINIKKAGNRLSKPEKALRLELRSLVLKLPQSKQEKYFKKTYSVSSLDSNIKKVKAELGDGSRPTPKTTPKSKAKPVDPPKPPVKESNVTEPTESSFKREVSFTSTSEEIPEPTPTIEESEQNSDPIINEPNTPENMEIQDAEVIEEVESSKKMPTPEFYQYNPLSEPVKERSYTKQETLTDATPIEEPDFNASNKFEETPSASEPSNDAPASEEPKEKVIDRITNESLNDLPPDEKKFAAKQMVETILDGYAALHELGKNFVKYPEEKLQKAINSGAIDPHLQIPVSETTSLTPMEFIKDLNESAAEAIEYDPKFGEKVRPAMEREFAKRGWGLSDLQFIGVMFGKDLAMKGMQVIQLKKTAKMVMTNLMEATSQMNQVPTEAATPDAIIHPHPSDEDQEEVFEPAKTQEDSHQNETASSFETPVDFSAAEEIEDALNEEDK